MMQHWQAPLPIMIRHPPEYLRVRPAAEKVRVPTSLHAAALIAGTTIDKQENCILFQIPGEIRQKIYTHVFAAGEQEPDDDNGFVYSSSWRGVLRTHTSLLRTCRAIYAEAYLMPLELSPACLFRGTYPAQEGVIQVGLKSTVDFLAAWQFAAVSSALVVVQQIALESELGALPILAKSLLVHERAAGVYLATNKQTAEETAIWEKDLGKWKAYRQLRRPRVRGGLRQTHFARPPRAPLRPDMSVSGRYVMRWEEPKKDEQVQGADLFYRANAISHITIRLDRADWWTWGYRPVAQHGDQGLALDPALGDGHVHRRPLVSTMLELAEQRRARRDRGQPPLPYKAQCWGKRIGEFKGLRRLTLQLETFAWRKAELEQVVECAKLWTFPIGPNDASGWDGYGESSRASSLSGPERVLAWDGHVEAYRWGEKHSPPEAWKVKDVPVGFEVRIISFH